MASAGEAVAADGGWVTFGITPDTPATGYGYINATGGSEVLEVQSFTEKPDRTAQSYLDAGGYFWNSGIFMVRADACIESFRRHAPDLASAADACWEASLTRDDETTLPKPALENVPLSPSTTPSWKKRSASASPFSGSWSDVGSWDSLSALVEAQRPETGDDPHAITVDAPNTFIHSSGRTIAAVGVEDLIVVDDDDATLIVGKGASEKVKDVIDQLKAVETRQPLSTALSIALGMFENLLDSDICKVKRLTVDPQHLIPAVPPQTPRSTGLSWRRERAAWRGAPHTDPGRGDV